MTLVQPDLDIASTFLCFIFNTLRKMPSLALLHAINAATSKSPTLGDNNNCYDMASSLFFSNLTTSYMVYNLFTPTFPALTIPVGDPLATHII